MTAPKEVMENYTLSGKKYQEAPRELAHKESADAETYPLDRPLNWTFGEPTKPGLYLVGAPFAPEHRKLVGVVRSVFGPRGGKRRWRWVEPVWRHFRHEPYYWYAKLTGPTWDHLFPPVERSE